MNTLLWQILPVELVNLILEYDGIIKLRNGKFMNQLLNIDNNYPLILERMCFNKNRRFYKSICVSTVDIHIPNTEKFICYWAGERELRVTLHRKDNHTAKILYYISTN